MEIKRDHYLNTLISKEHNGLIKVITGMRDVYKRQTQDEFRLFRRRYGIAAVMIAMIVILSIVSPTFRTAGNVVSIALQVSINGILALGLVFVITAGGIDLSIGSMLALTSVIIGLVLNATGSILRCV